MLTKWGLHEVKSEFELSGSIEPCVNILSLTLKFQIGSLSFLLAGLDPICQCCLTLWGTLLQSRCSQPMVCSLIRYSSVPFGVFFAPYYWQAACLPHCIDFFGYENWESCRPSKLFWWSVAGVVSISSLIRSNMPPAWPKQRHCSCWAPCASSCAAQLSCTGAQIGATHRVMGVSPVPTLRGGREAGQSPPVPTLAAGQAPLL